MRKKVKVRFTGEMQEIYDTVDFLRSLCCDVLSIRNLSAFYPNRNDKDIGRVYCDFFYLEEPEDEKVGL